MSRKISLENINFNYEKENLLFNNLNLMLDFDKYNTIAIVGKSGIGKSSLLNIISGIINNSEGKVFFGDNLVSNMSNDQKSDFRLEEIGFIYQDNYLFEGFNVKENLLSLIKAKNERFEENELEHNAIIKKFGIDSFINKDIAKLSKGEQQRISIARTLLTKPNYVFADEPTSNLDQNNASIIFEELLNSIELTDCKLLLVSHDPVIYNKCDLILDLTELL